MKIRNVGLFYPVIMILFFPFIMGKTTYESRLAKFIWSSESSTATDYFLIDKMYFFVVVTFAFFIYALVRDRTFKKNDVRIFRGLILYVLFCTAATIFSIDRYISLVGVNEQFEPYIVLVCYGLCAYLSYHFIKNMKEVVWIYWTVAVAVCVMGILGIVQFLVLHSKVYLTLYNSNYTGMLLTMLLPILYCRNLRDSGSKREIWLYRVALVLGMVTLLLSGSKTAVAVSVWSFLLSFLFKKGKWSLSTGYIVVSLIAGICFLGYQAVGTEQMQEGKAGVTNVETGKEGVTFERNGTRLTFRFEMPDEENYLFCLSDENGKAVSYEKNEEGTRYRPIDSRFDKYLFTIVMYDDFYGFLINIDNRDWYFARNEQGIYNYVNGYERLDSFQMAKAWMFRGNESFATNRGYLWSRSIPVLCQHIFAGSGPDTFVIVFPQNDVGKYLTTDAPYKMIFTKPHSLYLQIAIQTGAFSLVALLFYLFGILKLIWRKQNGFFLSIISYLFVAVFNDSCICVAPVFFVLTGIALAVMQDVSCSDSAPHVD